jgi:hypothetical protein
MSPVFYKEEAGAKGLSRLPPTTPNPLRTSSASLRFGPSRLTIPNTWNRPYLTCLYSCDLLQLMLKIAA